MLMLLRWSRRFSLCFLHFSSPVQDFSTFCSLTRSFPGEQSDVSRRFLHPKGKNGPFAAAAVPPAGLPSSCWTSESCSLGKTGGSLQYFPGLKKFGGKKFEYEKKCPCFFFCVFPYPCSSFLVSFLPCFLFIPSFLFSFPASLIVANSSIFY